MTSKFLLNHKKADLIPVEINGFFPIKFNDRKIWTSFGFILQFKIFVMLTKCSPVFTFYNVLPIQIALSCTVKTKIKYLFWHLCKWNFCHVFRTHSTLLTARRKCSCLFSRHFQHMCKILTINLWIGFPGQWIYTTVRI